MVDRITVKGACLCGQVTMMATEVGTHVGACHCGMCRKWGGGPLLAVESEGDVRFEGQEYITLYGSSDWAERGFCARCGTHLFYRLRGQHHYAFPAGFLTDRSGLTLTSQIFVDEKPDFYAFANETRNLTGTEVFAEFDGN